MLSTFLKRPCLRIYGSALLCLSKTSFTVRYDVAMTPKLAARHGIGFDLHQLILLQELCIWRDEIFCEKREIDARCAASCVVWNR